MNHFQKLIHINKIENKTHSKQNSKRAKQVPVCSQIYKFKNAAYKQYVYTVYTYSCDNNNYNAFKEINKDNIYKSNQQNMIHVQFTKM